MCGIGWDKVAGGGWQAGMETEGAVRELLLEAAKGWPRLHCGDTTSKTRVCSNLERHKKAPNDLVGLAEEISRQKAESAKQFLLAAQDVMRDREAEEETNPFSS